MTAAAQKVTILVSEFQIQAYQLTGSGQNLLLFTHRQIGEAVGKTKGTAQRFLKQHAHDFPPPVTASIPDKPRPVPLTDWEAAVAYWQHLASQGNETAIALTAAKDNLPLSDFEIVSATDGVPAAPAIESQTDKSELQRACGWHLHRLKVDGRSGGGFKGDPAGISPRLRPCFQQRGERAHWRLNELQKKVLAISNTRCKMLCSTLANSIACYTNPKERLNL